MPATFIHANPAVRADVGKVALMKGPLVYCLEEIDNGDNLASIYVSINQAIHESYDNTLLKGTYKLHLKGKKIVSQDWDEETLYNTRKTQLEEIDLTAIPYCYWGNRKTGEMLVWMKEWFDV